MRVLIVEDDYFSREMIHQLFLQDGHEAVGVESGEDALDVLTGMDFDVILTDINLEGMNGFELCEHLRVSRKIGPEKLPIIGVTVEPDSEQLEKARQKGMLTILNRPVTPADVVQALSTGGEEGQEKKEPQVAVFDPTAINQLAEVVGADKVAKLIDMFFNDLEDGLQQLIGLIEKRDDEQAASLAHRLAGSCANYGFLLSHRKLKQVQHLCEKSGCEGAVDPVRQVLSHIDSDRKRVESALG